MVDILFSYDLAAVTAFLFARKKKELQAAYGCFISFLIIILAPTTKHSFASKIFHNNSAKILFYFTILMLYKNISIIQSS